MDVLKLCSHGDFGDKGDALEPSIATIRIALSRRAVMSRRMMLLLMICLAVFMAAHIAGIARLRASLPAPDAMSLMLGAD